MKKILLSLGFVLLMSLLTQPTALNAQCVVDQNINAPGVYPDTLRDGCIYRTYFDTIQFAFPPDTVIFGQTLPFDSFVVSSVTIPASLDWAQWECDRSQFNCHYTTTPGQLTRGCVRIWGCPNKPSVPGDSIVVTGLGFFTVFGSSQSVGSSFNFGVTIPDSTVCMDVLCTPVGIIDGLLRNLNLRVAPNPVDHTSQLNFSLESNAIVKVDVLDLFGRKVASLHDGRMTWGDRNISLESLLSLAQGIYVIRFDLNDGQLSQSVKINILH